MDKVMPVTWVEPAYFGPFAVPTRISLDPRVTVLTGANDTGKSSVLEALRLAFSRDTVEESQVNQERKDDFSKDWKQDSDIICSYGLLVTQHSIDKQLVAGRIEVGDEIICARCITQKQEPTARKVTREGKEVRRALSTVKYPNVLMLREGEIRNPLTLANLNEAERKLLGLGFGQAFAPETFASQGRAERGTRTGRAQNTLNRRLREVLPSSMGLEFRLADTTDSGKELNISLVDPLNCYVAIGCRGAGVRKLLGLMGSLLSLNDLSRSTLLLIDEPENSLHADAQHMLRRLLENLAESPWIQVVYATHSPSMINTMRPESIRVLQRATTGDKPTSVIIDSPHKESFLGVRASLGISPADSLMYAPVVIVVEGDTEVLCLPQVLKKLSQASIEGFGDLETLLPEMCCVDGMGFSFAQVCHLAKAQRTRPIVFLDGDMEGHKRVETLRNSHPDVPILLINGRREFEQLVPSERYLAALAQELERDAADVSLDAFSTWVKQYPKLQELAFSKQIENWVGSDFRTKYCKSAVMRIALDLSEPKDIDAGPLRMLLAEVRRQLSG